MNELKVNIVNNGPPQVFTLTDYPKLGEVIDWPFAIPPIVGKVDSVVWVHTNEVTLTLNVVSAG